QRLRLKSLPLALRARGVNTVARKQYAHMHLVRFRFQPAEIALHAIPRLRPLVFLVFAIFGIALDDERLPFFGKLFKRDIRWDLEVPTRAHQVTLALEAVTGQPGFDDTLGQSSGAIRQGEVVIDADHSAEAAAGRARADRVVETEQSR